MFSKCPGTFHFTFNFYPDGIQSDNWLYRREPTHQSCCCAYHAGCFQLLARYSFATRSKSRTARATRISGRTRSQSRSRRTRRTGCIATPQRNSRRSSTRPMVLRPERLDEIRKACLRIDAIVCKDPTIMLPCFPSSTDHEYIHAHTQ